MGTRNSRPPELCWPQSCVNAVEDEYSLDPYLAWSVLQVKQTVRTLAPISHDTPKPEGHTRFVCLSDTHTMTQHLSVPPGDVLLHAGDFSNIGLPEDIENFSAFLGSLPHSYKVVIAGNHELTFDVDSYDNRYERVGHPQKYNCIEVKSLLTSCIYLEDEETTVLGFKIYGSPWYRQTDSCVCVITVPYLGNLPLVIGHSTWSVVNHYVKSGEKFQMMSIF